MSRLFGKAGFFALWDLIKSCHEIRVLGNGMKPVRATFGAGTPWAALPQALCDAVSLSPRRAMRNNRSKRHRAFTNAWRSCLSEIVACIPTGADNGQGVLRSMRFLSGVVSFREECRFVISQAQIEF
jgi:hypothetical protein